MPASREPRAGRRRDRPPRPKADDVFVGQVTDAATLRGAAEGVATVYSTIGITRQRDHLTYEQVDYAGNLALLLEAERAGVQRFTYVAVFGGGLLRTVRLVDAKERFVDALVAGPLQHTIVRPTGFFSDMEAVLDMAARGRVYLVGDGQHRINPISGRDLAVACVQATESGSRQIEVGGPEIFSYQQIARLAAQVVGRPVRITHLPPGLLRTAASPLRMIAPARHGPLQFFLAVMTHDLVAPGSGTDRLGDFFRQASAGRRRRGPSVAAPRRGGGCGRSGRDPDLRAGSRAFPVPLTPPGPGARPCGVALTPEAQRQHSRMPEKIVVAVLEGLYGSIARDPWRASKPLHDELAGLRVARRSEYRVVFRIDENSHLIVVRRVDHRRDVYRPR
jgi:uncharacterized protein YbjT (DUF2867 family)/mRNA-degrading endonuclease RelE of RelBE toxin-antitoxin system